MSVITAPKQAMRNKNTLLLCKTAGCYKCLKIFPTEEIKNYTDQGQTALCPHCNEDTVLPDLELNELTEIHNYWFN